MTRSQLAAWVAAVAIAATGCGTDDNTVRTGTGGGPANRASVACATGEIVGAGATFPQPVVQQWIKEFGGSCPGATVSYQSVGSGAGIEQFTAGTVDFGASDAIMSAAEERAAVAKGGPVLHLPWTAGGVAVLYNVQGVSELRLGGETLAGIFAGRITKWDAPEIVADNPGLRLPGTTIQVVHRSDGSGTTKVFTSYLTAVAPGIWTAGADKDVPWPTGQGAKGSDGVSAAVKQADGAISYAELSYATATGLPTARIRNAAGQYVGATPEAVSAALRDAKVPADLKVEVTYTPRDPAAYPISSTTWALVYERPKDKAKAALVAAFLRYALGPGQAAAPELGYAPLPEDLLVKARAAVDRLAA